MRASRLVLLSALAAAGLAVALAIPISAHPESAAPSLRPDVLRAGHEPEIVQPHTQWHGFLELRAGSNVTGAYYQVCRVGEACFAPPTPAARTDLEDGGIAFRFDTTDYLANGRPVDYQPGWRIGITWILEERLDNGSLQAVRFPVGPDVLSPGCQGDAALACAEAHYLAFDIPADRKGASAPAWSLLTVALALAAATMARAKGPRYRRGRQGGRGPRR